MGKQLERETTLMEGKSAGLWTMSRPVLNLNVEMECRKVLAGGQLQTIA
jgi:hypothetical protein